MRIAFFSPLPPEPTGIGDYSYELLEELRELVDVTAVVSDSRRGSAQAPEGVELVGAGAVDLSRFDANVYQMGNNPKYHRFVFHRALEDPGLLVMHDPSLADYLAELCGDAESAIFRAEVTYDNPAIGLHDDLPLVDVGDGTKNLDRLRVLLARRIVTSNVRTLVNSEAIAAEMRRRYPGNEVHAIQLPGKVLDRALAGKERDGVAIQFGVFGGINYYKRIRPTVDAFLALRRRYPAAKMVIAGRADDRLLTAEIRQLAAREDLAGSLEVKTDLTLEQLEHEMLACDVAISLRWPTAGEMSATLMRCLGAGRPAVVSDVLQFRELDEQYCWRVPVQPADAEAAALLEIMERAAEDPVHCREVGQAAWRFVEREANYKAVARRYVEHLEDCIPRLPAARTTLAQRSLDRTVPLGVNLITLDRASESQNYGHRLADALGRAGVDVVEVTVPVASLPDRKSDEWHLDLDLFEPDAEGMRAGGPRPAVRKPDGPRSIDPQSSNDATPDGGTAGADPRAQNEVVEELRVIGEPPTQDRIRLGPHEVDLFVVGEREAEEFAYLGRHALRQDQVYVAVVAPSWVPLPLEYELFLGDAVEVWVPSEAAAVAIRVGAHAPVLALPPLVGAGLNPVPPSDLPGCRFVVHVDGRESFARQNPWASIAAFREAFASGERGAEARLVVVVNDVDPRSEGARRLRLEVDRADAELVEVTREAVDAQIAAGDVFLALHRSEAFGTEILDVMGMARPVVATAFLGVREYLNGRNGCPVGYSMREADPGDFYLDANVPGRARRGECWADPDIEQGARWMRKLAASPALRRLLGERAAATAQQLGEFELDLEAQTWRVIDREHAMRQRARLAKAEGQWRVDELLGRHRGAGLAAAGAGVKG